MDELLLPFQLTFMINAFWVMAMLSIPTALLSCYLVLKGWSLIGDAVSHAVLPGIVLAYVAGIPLLVGAFFAGLFCALATGFIAENSRVKRDTVMGVVFSGMFGLGIVLYTQIETDVHLDHILFGNMLGTGPDELWLAGVVLVLVGGAIAITWKDLLAHAFDPNHARAIGLHGQWLHYGLLVAITLTIIAVLNAVGIVLAIGLLIAPGAIAFLLTKRFSHMLVIAVAINFSSAMIGIYASFFLDSAPAPTVILVLAALFVIVFVVRQSMLAKAISAGR